jgi:hypothetical protein
MANPPTNRAPFDPLLAEAVCEAVLCGQTLDEACAPDGMPTVGQVIAWARQHPEFAASLDESRRESTVLLLERLSVRCRQEPEGLGPRTVAQHLSHTRLIFTVQRLLLSFYDPQTFGRIRGPRVSTYAEPAPRPVRAPAAAPAAAAPPAPVQADPDAEAERDAFLAECAAQGIDDETAEMLLSISDEELEAEMSPIAAGIFAEATSADDGGKVVPFTPPAPAEPPSRYPRRFRRAMAAKARKRGASSANGSRAPPG